MFEGLTFTIIPYSIQFYGKRVKVFENLVQKHGGNLLDKEKSIIFFY